jgi:hypothetical protein
LHVPDSSIISIIFCGSYHDGMGDLNLITRPVNLVTNLVIIHELGKDREVFTTSGTYLWSFVTQLFHNGQPSHDGDHTIFEVMTST